MGQTLSETNINNTLSSRIGPWSNSQWGSRTSGKKQFRKITCNCERWRVNENITIEIVKAKEMKPVMTSLGLNVTFLSKKKCKKYSIISINEESEHYNYSEL